MHFTYELLRLNRPFKRRSVVFLRSPLPRHKTKSNEEDVKKKEHAFKQLYDMTVWFRYDPLISGEFDAGDAEVESVSGESTLACVSGASVVTSVVG